MIIRRYYRKGVKYGRTYSDEYLESLASKGFDVSKIDNASYEIVFESKEEERAAYEACLNLVLNKTRWVLDNLERLTTFRVSWEDYHRKKSSKPKSL